MIRASLLLALVLAACGGSEDRHIVDAQVDGAGVGSDAMAVIDPHPHDHKLELLVAGLSLVVVLGPVHGARKRRDNV
jgi:hypothetical protein